MNWCMEISENWTDLKNSVSENFCDNLKPKQHFSFTNFKQTYHYKLIVVILGVSPSIGNIVFQISTLCLVFLSFICVGGGGGGEPIENKLSF